VQMLLLSTAFEAWFDLQGGSTGVTPTMKVGSVVGTFPIPITAVDDTLAAHWQRVALDALRAAGPGLTDVLNSVHDPSCQEDWALALRRTYEAIDSVVATSYGWAGVDLGREFRPTDQGVRFTMGPAARAAILDWLL